MEVGRVDIVAGKTKSDHGDPDTSVLIVLHLGMPEVSAITLPQNASVYYSTFAPETNDDLNALELARRQVLASNIDVLLLDSLLPIVELGPNNHLVVFKLSSNESAIRELSLNGVNCACSTTYLIISRSANTAAR